MSTALHAEEEVLVPGSRRFTFWGLRYSCYRSCSVNVG